MDKKLLEDFIIRSLQEDVGEGDHTTLASIPEHQQGTAILKVKEEGVLAGVEVARQIFLHLSPDIGFNRMVDDGQEIRSGQIVFEMKGPVHAILQGERLALNCMQRMSGIATLTKKYVDKIAAYHTQLLDTRKTTPGIRFLEKAAVKAGGGLNHRMGLYDMVMLKDNHIDFCGGITKAILKTEKYLKENNLHIPVEVEVRSLEDVHEVISTGKVNRIMFDNFSPEMTAEGVALVNKKFETESSGNITLDTIEEYAKTGVDFISSGAIIHHAVSLDLSLKAAF